MDWRFHCAAFHLFEGKAYRDPGRQYILDEDYYRRIEAINFAVKHDDGKCRKV